MLANKKERVNRSFALFSIVVILWLILDFSLYQNGLADWQTLLNKYNLVNVCLLVLALAYFVTVFPREIFKMPNWLKVLIGLASILMISLILFTDKIIQYAFMEDYGSNFKQGPYFFIFASFASIFALYSAIILIYKFIKFKGEERQQIKYIFYGIAFLTVFNLLFNLFVPIITKSFRYARLGTYSAIFFVAFTAYAILKAHLFNLRIILTETAVVIIDVILTVQIFTSKSIIEALLRTVFALVVFYGSYILVQSVKEEIRRRQEIEKLSKILERTNKNLLTLQHINNKMVSTLDVKKVSQEIVESLVSELSWQGGFLALVDDAKNRLYIQAMTRKIALKVKPYLEKPIKKYSLPLLSGNSILQQALRRFEIEFSSDLSRVIEGAIEAETAKKIQKKLKINTFACAPIVYRGKVIGALVVGLDKEQEKIAVEDKKMISSIADQAAIAIENAKLYEEVEKANIKLKELDKLKNEFLSIASHQVRTPLSIIKGYVSLLRAKKVGEISEQQDRFMKNIQEANDQLINIINDFLNLSRIEQKRMKLEITESDVKMIIQEVIERMNHEAELKKIKLDFIKENDLPKINIDEPKMIEVITNLIDNAIKYSPEKSEVEVALKKDGDKLKISVADQGIGIPKDFKDKLFQKFSRAHNAIQAQPNGNGIGLFLVKKIIDAHQGIIEIKTKEGKGTIFTVNLNYKSGLKAGEEVNATELSKKGYNKI
ncbi:GAF domain-containing protein [Patescibacteria group bacterium]|nr:GAF domain-containing protein [Patescibacteria group bacterium]